MHYHLEIIMPPCADVNAAVDKILAPFYENTEGDNKSSMPFWDFYIIGGRMAGAKIEAKIGEGRMKDFYAALKERNVTVSGLQWGKQELSPADQIPMVDDLWREMMPDSSMDVCPLFLHSNRNDKPLIGDICTIADCPKELEASRVIIGAPDYKGVALEAVYMVSKSIWNGVNHEDTKFTGNVLSVLPCAAKKFEDYKDEYKARITPQQDWLVVTIDYHT